MKHLTLTLAFLGLIIFVIPVVVWRVVKKDKMSWIKEANKIGKYERSHLGFRIYCTKEPEINVTIEDREDGHVAAYRLH